MTRDAKTGDATTLPRQNRRAFLALLVLTLLLSLAATLTFDHNNARSSVFTLGNWVGPTAETLFHAQGLTVCSTGLGTVGNPICFHAARMPVPSAVVALGARLFGDHFLRVGVFKALLLLVPLELAIALACRRLPRSGSRRMLCLALLLVPFLLTPFLANVVNMQVEEGYSYSLLALATALVLFRSRLRGNGRESWRRTVLFAVTAALLYLSKSSMAPAVAVLTAAYLWPLRRSAAQVAAVLLLVALAPLGWAAWQHHAAGRYTLGTSIDGVNLHKGNNPQFLDRYPPAPGYTLDVYDPAMNRGLFFPDEWSFNDYHQHAAIAFMRQHPGLDLRGDLVKLRFVLFSFRKVGSQPGHGVMEIVESLGVILFRLLFWAALLAAFISLGRRGTKAGTRTPAIVYLLLVAAVAFPYVVGFAYTRHISVLLYPAVLLCCRVLESPSADPQPALGLH